MTAPCINVSNHESPLAAVGMDGVYRLTPGMDLALPFHHFVDFLGLSAGLRGHCTDAGTSLLE